MLTSRELAKFQVVLYPCWKSMHWIWNTMCNFDKNVGLRKGCVLSTWKNVLSY